MNRVVDISGTGYLINDRQTPFDWSTKKGSPNKEEGSAKRRRQFTLAQLKNGARNAKRQKLLATEWQEQK